LAVVCLSLSAAAVHAQSDSVVLRGGDVSEDALLSLLSPASDKGGGTRQVKLESTKPSEPIKLTEPIKAQIKSSCSSNLQRQTDAGTAAPRAAILINFETNSTNLSEDARRQLDVVARAFGNERLNRFNFLIEGHADPRGLAADNMRLSQARANSVREYLVTRGNVESERLASVGKGSTQLMNTCNVSAPENRRVAFVTVTQ